MKKQILIWLMFLTTIFIIPGCYTVIWSPDMQFPSKENSDYQYDGYYSDPYYGNYNYYYDHPWWLDIPATYYTPPGTEIQQNKNGSNYNRSTSTSILRSGGRGTESSRPIIQNTIPTRSGNTSTTKGSTTTYGKNNHSDNAGAKTESQNSSSSRSSNTNSSNTLRNNDGGRNNNNGRH